MGKSPHRSKHTSDDPEKTNVEKDDAEYGKTSKEALSNSEICEIIGVKKNDKVTKKKSSADKAGFNIVEITDAIKGLEVFSVIKNVLSKQTETISKLSEKIEDLQNQVEGLTKQLKTSQKRNTSHNEWEITGQQAGNSRKCESKVLIKPRTEQESNVTKEEIRQAIKPSDLGVSIARVANTKQGGVVLTCESRNETEKIRGETVARLGHKYDVKVPLLKKPKIKIVGLDEEYDEEKLRYAILNQNKFVPRNAELKLIVCKKMRIKWFAIVECDAETYRCIIDNGALCVEFNACSVYEHVEVRRCYNCFGFFHSSKYCTKPRVCLKCGGSGHLAKDCVREEVDRVCPNCVDANEKFGLGLDVKHSSFHPTCPILNRNISNQKKSVDYGDT